MGIEERICGNSRDQLIKKWVFSPGVLKKLMWNFHGVFVFDPGISKGCHTILQNFYWLKLAFSRISKGKVANLKIEVGFSDFREGRYLPYILNPPCLDFFWKNILSSFIIQLVNHNLKVSIKHYERLISVIIMLFIYLCNYLSSVWYVMFWT